MRNTLVVQGQSLSLPSFGGAVNDKGTLIGVRRFVANAFGLSETLIEGKTMKEVKTLAIANGATDEKLKELSKTYDAERTAFYREGNLLNGMLASDPNYRKTLRIVKNQKGDVIGANCSYRKERSANATKDQIIEGLKAQVAKLTALVGPVAAH